MVGVMSCSPPHSQCLQLCQPAKGVENLNEDGHVAVMYLLIWETLLPERKGLLLTANYIARSDEDRCNMGPTVPPAGGANIEQAALWVQFHCECLLIFLFLLKHKVKLEITKNCAVLLFISP